jgi:hypothetical protein
MSVSEHDWRVPSVEAHKHSSNHRDELERSELRGCFHCLAMFPPARVLRAAEVSAAPGSFGHPLARACAFQSGGGAFTGERVSRVRI